MGDYPYKKVKIAHTRAHKNWYERGKHNPADVRWIEKLRKERYFAELFCRRVIGFASCYGGTVIRDDDIEKVVQLRAVRTNRGSGHGTIGELTLAIPKNEGPARSIIRLDGIGQGEITVTGNVHDLRAALIALGIGLREALKGTRFGYDEERDSDYPDRVTLNE